MSLPNYDDIAENLSYLDDWEERYAYVIQLGRSLPPLTDALRTDTNKVMGCASQVWLATDVQQGADPVLTFSGDSDAHIVRGLVALAIALNSGKNASEIIATDTFDKFEKLGLKVSSQRSNGLRSMVARIRQDAERALNQS